MCNFLSLSGLTLDIIGVGILVRDEITSMAATIKQHESTISGSWWQNAAYYLARKFEITTNWDGSIFLTIKHENGRFCTCRGQQG